MRPAVERRNAVGRGLTNWANFFKVSGWTTAGTLGVMVYRGYTGAAGFEHAQAMKFGIIALGVLLGCYIIAALLNGFGELILSIGRMEDATIEGKVESTPPLPWMQE